MNISDKINNLIELYECIHVEHVDDYSEVETWGLTNRKGVVPNEHTKDIIYNEELYYIKIKDVMHGSIIDEYGQMVFDHIEPADTEIRPSRSWENGILIIFHHINGGETTLDFFN